jgi:hypothetical protein
VKEFLRFEFHVSMGAGRKRGKPGTFSFLESLRKLKL